MFWYLHKHLFFKYFCYKTLYISVFYYNPFLFKTEKLSMTINNDNKPVLAKSFRALRPIPEKASEVIAPPYDVLNSDEARTLASDKPLSFLHVSKPEVDLPGGTPFDDPRVYDQGLRNLSKLINENILIEEDDYSLYICEISTHGCKQTGVAFVASLEAYDLNLIKKHEYTTPRKEDDRVQNISRLNAQTGPVMLTYESNQDLKEILSKIIARDPIYDVYADEGPRHKIWQLSNIDEIDAILNIINNMSALFIADGHHRSAAAAKVRDLRKRNNANHNGRENYNYFLSVAFPHDEMNILSYNRVIKDINKHTKESLFLKIRELFDLELSRVPFSPSQPKQFGMYFEGVWYKLELKKPLYDFVGPLKSLDVSILHHCLLEPILGIKDERTDQRIDFIGGAKGLKTLEKKVDSKDMMVAFSLFPTAIEDLILIAKAGKMMPPKSTWFEPKLLDGLLTHRID